MLQQQQQQQQHAATSAARRVKCAQCGASALCTEHALCSCAFAPICESCLCGQQQQQQQQQQKGKQESVEAARVSRFVAGPLTTLARGIEALLRNTEGQKDLEKATDDIKKQFGEMFDEMLSAEWDKFNAEREMQVRAKHKIQVVEELVATEVDYLADLRLLVGWWQVELVKANLLTSEEICIIFGNIAEMVLLSGELLEELKRCKEAPSVKQLIGAAFLKRIPFFKLYTEYTAGRDDATEIIIDAKRNHKFVTLHDKLRAMPQTKGLGLDDYLIKPAQRIMKYPLLLRDLMKDTPADHPDSKNLMKACQEMEEVLAKINTETKRRQTARVVQTLQPNLIWRKEGYDLTASQSHLVFTGPLNTTVVWVGSESNVQGDEVFLFDMCVLVCRVRLGKWEELATFAIKEIQICDVAEGDSADFTIKSARQDCYAVFHPVDKNEQRLWLFHFQEALKEAQSQKKTLVMLDAAAQQQRLEQQILEQQQVAQSDKHTPTHPLRRAGTSSKLIQQAKQAQPQLTREASTSRIPLTYKENSKDLQRGDSPRDIAPPPKDGKEATTPELVSAAPPATVAPVPTSPMPAASPTPKVEKKDKKKEEKEKKEKKEKEKKEKKEKEKKEKEKKDKKKKEEDEVEEEEEEEQEQEHVMTEADIAAVFARLSKLILAAQNASEALMQELNKFKKVANVNMTGRDGGSLLHSAAYAGNVDVILWLIRQGASVNVKDEKGWSPLMCAVNGGKFPAATVLLSIGAKHNMINNRGHSALHLLCKCRQLEPSSMDILRVLLSPTAGIDINARSTEGETALFVGCNTTPYTPIRASLLEALLQAKADPNVADNLESTPLIRAVQQNNGALVDLLLKYNADPKKGPAGENAIDVATAKNNIDLLTKIESELIRREEIAAIGPPEDDPPFGDGLMRLPPPPPMPDEFPGEELVASQDFDAPPKRGLTVGARNSLVESIPPPSKVLELPPSVASDAVQCPRCKNHVRLLMGLCPKCGSLVQVPMKPVAS
eukprot:TRINITY_DN208_c0_g1_i5.p1 TRINITY_DN208_c0_g1~~TRINITY_DN208_c0_g1_i5.p1  ORF type:complete len:1005 (+),score=336.94 TRINITY_DN208_c0_g1_i5:68-3082(+)